MNNFNLIIVMICTTLVSCGVKQNYNPNTQNPSPMEESIRSHARVSSSSCLGNRIEWEMEGKKVRLFVPQNFSKKSKVQLIIHFHGMSKVSEFAICQKTTQVMVTISGGSGSSSYERIFKENENFKVLLNKVKEELEVNAFSNLTLAGWSAGYGAIRALISSDERDIDNVILLDGLHASYIPDGQVIYKDGKLDESNLSAFYKFSKKATDGKKNMIITHTSIFPGTFANTTECTQYLIDRLKLERLSVLKEGPGGMQQVGEVISGNLQILSYAGNTAPDHVDHLHGLGYFLDKILED